ncbi:MAG TPA: hypothetical protein VFS24_14765, partial [Steroidobacteraceae bacterium]|nr:hypothetical protein [Steroidobacteraceae bacterium]
LALSLMSTASFGGNETMDRIASAGIRDTTMLDLSQPSFNDPKAVDVLFKEGNSIASILEGLNEKGFHIEYKKKQVPPTMTLVALPKATRIDDVLNEILEPWNLAAFRSPMGKLIVRPDKKKAAELANAP